MSSKKGFVNQKMKRYLVRLANPRQLTGRDTMKTILTTRRTLDDLGGVVKNLRISDIAIEFDLYVRDEEALDKNLSRLSKKISHVLTFKQLEPAEQEPKLPKEKVIEDIRRLFNEQRFWECHETLEQVWRTETGDEKILQQGIILVASALVHYQRDEPGICISMLRRALDKLRVSSNENYFSINIGKLKADVEQIIKSGEIRLFTI